MKTAWTDELQRKGAQHEKAIAVIHAYHIVPAGGSKEPCSIIRLLLRSLEVVDRLNNLRDVH